MSKRLKEKDGFTLVEIMVVVVIFTLSAALIFPSIVSGLGSMGLKSTTRKMASSLRQARNQALRHREVYYAEAQGGRLVIRTIRSVTTAMEMELTDYTVTGPGNRTVIAFYPGGGSSGGLFEVKDVKNKSYYEIKVEPSTGRVRTGAVKRYD